MNQVFIKICLLIILLTSSVGLNAQLGPGGVSKESSSFPTTGGSSSTVTIWCDANSIPSADGTYIDGWTDEAPYKLDNSAFTKNDVRLKPIVLKNQSSSINGNPIIRFGGGRRLLFNTSNDINTPTNPNYIDKKTIFVAFRTGADITTRQVIYEEGGNVRGLNISIFNGRARVGAYDIVNDGDGTPKWDYVSTGTPVQAFSTYILQLEFYVPSPGNKGGRIRGFLNGSAFIEGDALNVGTLWQHPDVPGIGSANANTVFEGNAVYGDGSFPFLGDLAELIHYMTNLNDAERIVVENYLAAKYAVNGMTTDRYSYKTIFLHDVVGVGKHTNGDEHNSSMGRNPFAIQATSLNNDEWLLAGHNAADNNSWTAQGAPKVNTLVLPRQWRFDHNGGGAGASINTKFILEENKVPISPDQTLFSKYVLVVDNSGGAVADFTREDTQVIEFADISGNGFFEATTDIQDGAFVTIGLVRPTFSFISAQSYGFEDNSDQPASITLGLNYTTSSSSVILNFDELTGGTATELDDYSGITTTSVTVPLNARTVDLPFTVVGDNTAESTESFLLELKPTVGFTFGDYDTHEFTIYDDDSDPEFEFKKNNKGYKEHKGTQEIEVIRTGNSSGPASVSYRLATTGSTATLVDDFSFASGTLNFADGETSKNFSFTIIDDVLDEVDETAIFELYNVVGADLSPTKHLHTLTIKDNDNGSTVEFLSPTGHGSERIGNPVIEVSVSPVSAKDISVEYSLTGGSATINTDFNMQQTGVVTIPAGASSAVIPIFVVSDQNYSEGDETVILRLQNPTNANIGSNNTFTYTIEDYIGFEWTGVAGVGLADDNVFWYNADFQNTTNDLGSMKDFSPNGINTDSRSSAPAILANRINGHKTLEFDSNDAFRIPDDVRINRATSEEKYIFTVFRKSNVNVNPEDFLFESGGNSDGMSIFIYYERIYFRVWNGNDYRMVRSGKISNNTPYFCTFHYNYQNQEMEIYVNGKLDLDATSYANGNFPRLDAQDNDNGLGRVDGNSEGLSGNVGEGYYFTGEIAEMIYFNEPRMNSFRQKVIENYLSAKYDIPFADTNFDFYPYQASHGNEVIGVGQHLSSSHFDSQGPFEASETKIQWRVRIQKPLGLDNGEYVFTGHDGADIAATNNTDIHPDLSERLERTWRYHEMGEPGEFTISFQLRGTAYNTGSELSLLKSTDGTFVGSEALPLGKSWDPINEIVTFFGVNLNDGDYYTLGFSPKQWTGLVSTDWINPGNWRGGVVPTNTINAWIPQNPIGNRFPDISATNATCYDLVIETGARLRINPTGGLFVYGNLNIAGEMTILTGGRNSGSLITDKNTQTTGVVTIHRKRIPRRFHYFGIPVDVADNELTFKGGGLYFYDETVADEWDENSVFTSAETGWKKAVDGNLKTNYNPIEGFMHISHVNSITFKGKPNTGDFTKPITFTDSGNGTNNEFDGWNLIGNPYPSSLDWDKVWAAQDPQVEPSVYFYKDLTGEPAHSHYHGYAYLNGTTGASVNGATKQIPPQQAFFVRTTSDATFRIDNDMRIHSSKEFYKKNESIPLIYDVLKLAVNNGEYKDECLIMGIEDAQKEHDSAYDAKKMFAYLEDGVHLFSLTPSNSKMAINCQNLESLEEEIPLGLVLMKTETVDIEVANLRFADDRDVFLWDKVSGRYFDLKANEKVTVRLEKGSHLNRFAVVFQKTDAAKDPAAFRIYAHRKMACIENYEQKRIDIRICDQMGRIIMEKINAHETLTEVPVDKVGIFFVTVRDTESQDMLHKKVWIH